MYDLTELQNIVRNKLPEKRYYHTLGVANTSATLAMRYGEDMERAFVAGLFHDIAKPYSDEKLLAKCRKYDLPVSQTEERSPYLLHGKVGAYLANTKYGIEDDQILKAITFHTTGRAGMSLLEKIVFLADYMEPNRREVPGLQEIRREAFCDLTKTVCMVLRDTVNYLETKADREIDETTRLAYQYYCDEE